MFSAALLIGNYWLPSIYTASATNSVQMYAFYRLEQAGFDYAF